MLRTVFIVLALAGCESDLAQATRHCAPVPDRDASACVAAFMDNAQARHNADNAMAGAMIVNGTFLPRAAPAPIFTTCTRAGCITQ